MKNLFKSLKFCVLILSSWTLPAFSESSAVRMFSPGFSDNKDVVPDKAASLDSVKLYFSEGVTLKVADFKLLLNDRPISLTGSTIVSLGKSKKIFTFKFPSGRTSLKGIYQLIYNKQKVYWGNGTNSNLAKPPTNASKPGVPVNAQGLVDGSQANLQWERPTSDGGYKIFQYWVKACANGETDCSLFSVPVPQDGTSATFTGLAPGTFYRFSVQAYSSAGSGPAAEVTLQTTSVSPGMPTNLVATPSDSKVSLSWAAPASNGGEAITEYVIESAENGSAWTRISRSNLTDLTILNEEVPAVNGRDYRFRVAAVNRVGQGPFIETSSVQPVPPVTVFSPGISADMGVIPDRGNLTQLTLYFSDSVDLQLSHLSLSRLSRSFSPTTNPPSKINLTTLTPNRDGSYSLKVPTTGSGFFYGLKIKIPNRLDTTLYWGYGVNMGLTKPSSAVLPSSPGNLRVSTVWGDGFFDLKWDYPAQDGGSPVFQYRLSYCEKNNCIWKQLFYSMEYPYAQTLWFAPGKTYQFKVTALNSVGESLESSVISVDLLDYPAAPRVTSVTVANGRVNLSWSAPTNTGGGPLRDYEIQYSSDFGHNWTKFQREKSVETSAQVTGLISGLEYIFKVKAFNSSYGGDFSDSSTPITFLRPPGAVSNLVAQAQVDQITVTWGAPAQSGGGASIDRYVYKYRSNNGTTWSTEVSTSDLTATLTGLTPSLRYKIRVAAVTSAGRGDDQDVEVTTLPATAPGDPTNITGVEGNSQVVLNWIAPSQTGGSALKSYKIQYSRIETSTWFPPRSIDTGSPSTSYTVTGLTNGLAYQFKVQSVNQVGASPGAISSTFSPRAGLPGAPANLAGSSADGSVNLTWANPSNTGGAPISAFQVDYQLSASSDWLPVSRTNNSALQESISMLIPNQLYNFRVRARNSVGWGDYATLSVKAISIPVITYTRAENGRVRLSWKPPTGPNTFTDYRIEFSTNGVWTVFDDGVSKVTSTLVTDLTNGQAYRFRVSAIDLYNNVYGPSAESRSVTPLGPPGAPSNLRGTPSTQSIFLSWGTPSLGNTNIGFYEIEQAQWYGTDWGDWVPVLKTADLYASLYFNTQGISYRFRVSAFSYMGRGAYSVPTGSLTPINQNANPIVNSPGNLLSQTVRQTPCEPEAGQVGPDQGSGMCTGNYQTALEIPYFGRLIYNSHRSEIDVGYGTGFDLEEERRIIRLGKTNQFVLEQGDGTRIALVQISGTSYRAKDIRRNINQFTLGSDEATERTPEGVVMKYRLSSRIREGAYEIVSVIEPNGNTTEYSRDRYGRLNSITDAYNNTIRVSYGDAGNMYSLIDTAGNINTISYQWPIGIEGRRYIEEIRSTGDSLFLWRLGYDPQGRINSVTDFQGAVEYISYDDKGRLSGIVNENNYTTSFAYTESSVTSSNSLSFTEETFENGLIKGIRVQKNNSDATVFSRDAQGRISSVTLPNRMSLALSYMGSSPTDYKTFHNVTSVTRTNGSVSKSQSFSYDCNTPDNLCDLTSQKDEAGINTSFSQFVDHLPGSVSVNGKTTSYSYENRLPVSIRTPFGEIKRSYNSDGTLASVTDISGQTTIFDYDGKGRMRTATDHFGRTTQVTYDSLGRPTLISDSSQSSVGVGYNDLLGRNFVESETYANGAYFFSTNYTTTIDPSSQKTTNVSITQKVGGQKLLDLTQSFDTSNGYQTGNGLVVSLPGLGVRPIRDRQNKIINRAIQ